MANAVGDCVEKNWTKVATMAGWRKGKYVFSYIGAILALRQLISKKREYRKCKHDVTKKTNIQRNAQQHYIRVCK